MKILSRVFCLAVLLTGGAACGLHGIPDENQTPVNEGDRSEFVVLPGQREQRKDFFAGAERCSDCHHSIYERWLKTAHAQPQPMSDNEKKPHEGSCIRCHMQPVIGCEACHGPSGTHAANPGSSVKPECISCDIQKQCIRCHARAVSVDFNLRGAMKQIDHGRDNPR